MSFSIKSNGIYTSDDGSAIIGDAAIAIQANFVALANNVPFRTGNYSTTANYQPGDIVLFTDDNYYLCQYPATAETPSITSDYWLQLNPYLPLTGGVLTGQLTGAGGNLFDDGSGNAKILGKLTLSTETYVAGTQPYLQVTTAGTGIQTNAGNVIDDGLGNAKVIGILTLPISTTSPAHSTATSVVGSGAEVHVDTEFAGSSGSTAYTINDLVTLLKSAGLLKA